MATASPNPVTPVQPPRPAPGAPLTPPRKLVLPVVTTPPRRAALAPATDAPPLPPLGEREQAIARLVVRARRTPRPLTHPPCAQPPVAPAPAADAPAPAQATRWLFVARAAVPPCAVRVRRIAATPLCAQLVACCWWSWVELGAAARTRVRRAAHRCPARLDLTNRRAHSWYATPWRSSTSRGPWFRGT